MKIGDRDLIGDLIAVMVILVLMVLFYGEPDVFDALVSALRRGLEGACRP